MYMVFVLVFDRNKRPKTKRPDTRNSLTYNPFIKPAKSQGYKLDYFITFYINIPTFFSYSFFKDTLTRKYLAGQRTLKNYSYSRNRVFFLKGWSEIDRIEKVRLLYFYDPQLANFQFSQSEWFRSSYLIVQVFRHCYIYFRCYVTHDFAVKWL